MINTASPTILLVEDSIDDVDLTRESLRRTNRNLDLQHVANGSECMDYLRKTGSYCDVVTPSLVLLDLNMPIMDGREVLTAVSCDPSLKQIPIVVLTTSSANIDLMVSYKLGCRSYLVKPVDFERFQEMVNELCVYWFDTALLPPLV